MTSNLLGQLYTTLSRYQLHSNGRVHVSWWCDPDAVIEIGEAGDLDLNGLCRSNLGAVNTYFDAQIALNPQLVTVVVDRLYQAALAPAPSRFNRNCWYNFVAAMTAKVARHIWQKIPPSKQSPDLFDRLITPTLNVQTLLTGFNPQHQPDLLLGLNAWTYKVVKYHTYADIRANGDPYFGRSNLGIVARVSYKLMRIAMAGNIAPTHVDSYISICKVFKNYLGRMSIGANQLELNHWEDIRAELKTMQIEISIDELVGQIDRVGNLVRADSTPIFKTFDDPDRPILEYGIPIGQEHLTAPDLDRVNSSSRALFLGNVLNRQADFSAPAFDEPDLVSGELLGIVDRYIDSLAPKAKNILFLRHCQKLKQREIGESIAKAKVGTGWEQLTSVEIDKLIHNYGSVANKQLRKIYSDLLDRIHSEIQHPEERQGNKNSLAIEAIKQLLDRYYAQHKL